MYTSSDIASDAVIVMLTGDRLVDANFKDLDAVSHAAGDKLKSLASGSVLQNLQAVYTSYDSARHVAWATSTGSSVLGGEIRTLIGMYITKVGTIQVACYAKAAEFEKYQAECKQIISSVKIAPEVEITPPAPLSELVRMATDQANTTYRQLVERVKAGDFSVDFRQLRMACARSSVCEVRAKPDELSEMADAEREKRQTDVVKICERLIEHGFINMEAHIACSQAYSALSQPEPAKSHMDIMVALFKSLLNAGDGKSEDTAYEVISVREVFEVLASKQLPQFGEGVSNRSYVAGGHSFSRWEVKDPKTQEMVVIFFNDDAFPPAK